jgi:hypothetical protein
MWYQPFEIPNINTSIEKYQKFLCEFVDLKRNGWRHYSTAFNELTYNYYKPVMNKFDTQVEVLAENMKSAIREKIL